MKNKGVDEVLFQLESYQLLFLFLAFRETQTEHSVIKLNRLK
jgi:hypothetical protein